MIEVFGVEGAWPDDAPLTWGAAAVRDRERVWNAVSGRGQGRDRFDAGGEEALVRFEPVRLPEDFRASPMIVVCSRGGIREHLPHAGCLRVVTRGDTGVLVFADRADFDSFTRDTVALLSAALEGEVRTTLDRRSLAFAGLTLAPDDPYFRAVLSAG